MFRRNISLVEKKLYGLHLRSVGTFDFDLNFNQWAYQTFLRNVNMA